MPRLTLPPWAFSTALLAVSLVAIIVPSLSATPERSVTAAVFPPWWSGAHALSRAAETGAAIIGIGAYPTIIVLKAAEPGSVARLRRAGALLLLDPEMFGGCFRKELSA